MTNATLPRTAPPPVFSRPLEIVRPSFPPLEEFIDAFRSALESGRVTNNGPSVQEFERRLELVTGVPTLVFSSGQAALMTMVRAAGITGGEVIVPSMTFAATPHAAVWAGATPVFADALDDMSFRIDPADIERRITSRTVAILSVDPYGIVSDYDALDEIGRRHGLKVLHDSAASFGAAYKGAAVGGYGDAQIFSFHATKAFNTMEGGALCSRNPDIIARARSLRNFGQSADGDCPLAGLNGKMLEISALIGIEQLKRFPTAVANRRQCADKIADGIAAIPGLRVAIAPDDQSPVWLYLPICVDANRFGCNRDQLASYLDEENLRVRKYYSPACHLMSVYRQQQATSLPIAERLASSVLALPIYNDMTPNECEGVVEAVRRSHARANQ